MAILNVQQVPEDSKQIMSGAQRRIAAAGALESEAVLRAVSGARDGPLEKARARELSTSLRALCASADQS